MKKFNDFDIIVFDIIFRILYAYKDEGSGYVYMYTNPHFSRASNTQWQKTKAKEIFSLEHHLILKGSKFYV